MIKMLNNNKGFSLVELLVSIVLLTILAIAFLPLLTTSYSGIHGAGERNIAMNEAQKKLEISFNNGTNKAIAEVEIRFSGVGTFKIVGENIKVREHYGDGSSIEIDAFIPKK